MGESRVSSSADVKGSGALPDTRLVWNDSKKRYRTAHGMVMVSDPEVLVRLGEIACT